MENKPSGHELLKGFTQLIRDGSSDIMHEWVIAGFETTGLELTNILRWKDDGGQMIGSGNPDGLLNPSGSITNI